MIPIKLTLQGIYSYQEKQSIDFTKLTEANLFGIFGSVGSGKSTILEAITYALYGKTDRLNQSGDNRNYNMMNLKSNELLIEFIFKTGKDDSEYLSVVKSRRNSRQFEDVKTPDRAAYRKTHGNWSPIAVDSLESVIGLSYDNFKRTIIIPQGKFQEFLQLGKTERTQMMKELFNLNKFELFNKVVSLESKNNRQLQNLEGQLQQLGEINPDQVNEITAIIDVLNREIEQKTKEQSILQDQESKFIRLKETVLKIRETELILTQLKEQESDYNLLEKNIREFEYCQLNFKNLLDSAHEIAGRIKLIEQTIASDELALNSAVQQLSELEKGFETVKKDFDGRELYKQQAEELDKIAKLHELTLSGTLLKGRITAGEKTLGETIDRISMLKQSLEMSSSSLRALRDQYPDLAMLSRVKAWHTTNALLLTARSDIELEVKSLQYDISGVDGQRAQLWNDKWLADIPQGTTNEVVSGNLLAKKEKIREMIAELNNEIEHLTVQSKLEEYAADLEEGKPCPLCGALLHPKPLDVRDVTDLLSKTRLQKISFEKEIEAIEIIQKQLSEIETMLQLKKELLAKAMYKQTEQNNKILAHQKLFTWDKYSSESEVAEEFKKAEKLQLSIKKTEEELEKIKKQVEEATGNKDKYSKAIEDLRYQFTANTTEITTLSGQIKLFAIHEFDNGKADEIEALKGSYLKKYRDIEDLYGTMSTKIASFRKETDILSGRLEANRKTMEDASGAQKSVVEKLREQVIQSEYETIAEVEAILAFSLNIEKEKEKVRSYRQTLDFRNHQLTILRKDMGDQPYDEALHQKTETAVKIIAEELSIKNKNLGEWEGGLKKLKADLETRKKLNDQNNSLQTRGDAIKTLKQLFKASGFVNYVSSVYLQELCYAANERFYKLSRQKLSIEVTDDNNFQVRDFMNGGKARNVKTLSGGQTFQAALSLALAMADNIQKITESNQNFFFLDEGFGSLDRESLNIVFDTLKSLRKENRIVGVISHVEEMQQEIDAHLKIANDEEKGSLIKPSWI